MFRHVTLSNFKSIRGEIDLELGDLTVMTGSNSSGKSTVLQSLLLLAQTFRHSGSDRHLVLNGPLVRLGSFSDVANAPSKSKMIGVGFGIAPPPSASGEGDSPQSIIDRSRRPAVVSVHWRFSDRPTKADGGSIEGGTFPSMESFSMFGSFLTDQEADPSIYMGVHRHPWKRDVRVSREGYADGLSESLHAALAWKVDLERKPILDLSGEEVGDVRGVVLDHCLPRELAVRVDIAQEFAEFAITSLTRSTRTEVPIHRMPIHDALWTILREQVLRPLDLEVRQFDDARTVGEVKAWIDSLSGIDRRKLVSRMRASRDQVLSDFRQAHDPEPWLWNAALPAAVQGCVRSIRSEIAAVRYLGPLRVQPAPLYPVATTLGSEDVGPSGEWTASVLDAYKEKLVTYVSPRQAPFQAAELETVTTTLAEGVNVWMQYLGVSGDVRTVDRGSMGHELTVQTATSRGDLPLTHVGVGVSQCLPVVVSLLLARPNTITLLEQPELHLHPAVQSRLADFLLAMTLTGRQCLVETHSEYIVNRLRLRVAQQTSDRVRDIVRMYFATIRDGASCYEKIELNAYGAVKNWPRGFFDEGQDDIEAILRAASEKRSNRGRRDARDR